MIVLVDYDNVRPLDRNRGVVQVVEQIVRKLGVATLQAELRAHVRLYGGWFQEQRLSRGAQRIAPAIQADFPRPISVSDASGAARIMTSLEMAQSLECDPLGIFFNTYRERAPQDNLQAKSLPFSGCANPSACELSPLAGFLAAGQCTTVNCSAKVSDVLFRPEQKLVDAMLVVDLMHFAAQRREPLVVVSSDDDIWPGIHSAVVNGATVHHVQTISGRSTPLSYSRLVAGKYFQYSM